MDLEFDKNFKENEYLLFEAPPLDNTDFDISQSQNDNKDEITAAFGDTLYKIRKLENSNSMLLAKKQPDEENLEGKLIVIARPNCVYNFDKI